MAQRLHSVKINTSFLKNDSSVPHLRQFVNLEEPVGTWASFCDDQPCFLQSDISVPSLGPWADLEDAGGKVEFERARYHRGLILQ